MVTTRMFDENGDLRVLHARTLQWRRTCCPDNVESRYTNDLAVVKIQLLLVLTHGKNHGVHRVYNHSHHRLKTPAG